MKSVFFLVLISFISFHSTAQDHKIQWFEKQSVGSEVYKMTRVIEIDNHYVFAVKAYSKFTDRILKIDHKGAIVINEPVLKDPKQNDIRLYGLAENKGKIYAYYRVISGPTTTIFRDEINASTLKFKGDPVEIMSGSSNPLDLMKPLWEKDERMEQNYFEGAYTPDNIVYIDFPEQNKYVLLKKETYKGNEKVELQAMVFDSTMEIINEANVTLPSTNTNTSLPHVILDDKGGLYLLTGDYIEKSPACTLYYLNPENKKLESFPIPITNHVVEMKTALVDDGIMVVGMTTEQKSKWERSVFSIKYSFVEKKFSAQKNFTNSVFNWSDRLILASNNEQVVAFIQDFESAVMSDFRDAGDVHVFMMSKDGSLSWYKNIPNRITSQKGSIYADSYFPFVHNSQFYLIQNTHEENPARALKGEKAKITMPGKDKMGTELISLGEKGKLKRDFIYLTESNFAPIPEMTQRIGAGKYLLYADHTFFGNSFMLGKLEVLK